MIRQTVVVAMLLSLSWSAEAQIRPVDGPKIRITGPKVYDMPGEVRSAAAGQVVTIPRSGERLEGWVISIDPTFVHVRLLNVPQPVLIPRAAIEKLEVRTGRRSRAVATTAGIAVGVGGFLGGVVGAFGLCGLDCGDGLLLAGVATGAALGGYTAHRMGGERWESMTIESLSERLTRVVP